MKGEPLTTMTKEPTAAELRRIELENQPNRAREEAVEAFTWQDLAACKGMNANLFFPERGASTILAKTICGGGRWEGIDYQECPVQDQCLKWALEYPERFGIWGALSERDRRRLRLGQT